MKLLAKILAIKKVKTKICGGIFDKDKKSGEEIR